MATSWTAWHHSRSRSKVKDVENDMVIILEDVLYRGNAAVSQIRELYRDADFLLDNNKKKQRVFIDIVCPYATREAIKNIEECLAQEEARAHIATSHVLPTLFDGMDMLMVLCMDVYICDVDRGVRTSSYLFDVLGLDDRQSMTMMPHKLNDMAMVPWTLLHALPDFPLPGAKLLLRFRDCSCVGRFLDRFLIDRRVPDADDSKHARTSQLVTEAITKNIILMKNKYDSSYFDEVLSSYVDDDGGGRSEEEPRRRRRNDDQDASYRSILKKLSIS